MGCEERTGYQGGRKEKKKQKEKLNPQNQEEKKAGLVHRNASGKTKSGPGHSARDSSFRDIGKIRKIKNVAEGGGWRLYEVKEKGSPRRSGVFCRF